MSWVLPSLQAMVTFSCTTIDTMNWPARSPDLNPIEHLWDVVGKQIRARRGELVSLQELRRVVQEE
jgi:hypothetical protein